MAISTFIVWTTFCLFVWIAPVSPARQFLFGVVSRYMFFLGLSQNFVVFSPDIDTTNANLVGIIKFADGSSRVWEYPDMMKMDIVEKVVRNRCVTYVFALQKPENRFLLPATARHIARLAYDASSRTKVPESVDLQFAWRVIDFYPVPSNVTTSGVTDLIHYKVETSDLQ